MTEPITVDTTEVDPNMADTPANPGTAVVPSNIDRRTTPALRAEPRTLTADQVVQSMELVRDIQKRVMTEGVDFGIIPGTGDKPTLLKPGAEKLLLTFRIAQTLQVEDLSEPPSDQHPVGLVRYRVMAFGTSMATRDLVGVGVGEASSDETRYKWRKASSQTEYDRTPADQRREMEFRKRAGGTFTAYQVRQNPYDVANTVLKMAKKRSSVDLALTVTAASGMFEQDLDEHPELARDRAPQSRGSQSQSRPAPQPPQERAPAALALNLEPMPNGVSDNINPANWQKVAEQWNDRGVISDGKRKRLFAIAMENGWNGNDLSEALKWHLGVGPDGIPWKTCYEIVVDIFQNFKPSVD